MLSIKTRTARTQKEVLYEILLKKIQDQGKNIAFMWVPAHVRIQGKEKADTIASRKKIKSLEV